jgi:hypothetical protein
MTHGLTCDGDAAKIDAAAGIGVIGQRLEARID